MQWYPRLYVGESVNNPDKLIHKLKRHAKRVDAYVITLSKNPYDQLEIYEAKYLSQKYYKNNPPYIIGVAGDYEEAVDIVKQIAEETMAAQGNCLMKEYLKCYM